MVGQCSPCKEWFTTDAAFDIHRVGKHEYLYWEGLRMNPSRIDGRRCLSVEEMEAHKRLEQIPGRASSGGRSIWRVKKTAKERQQQAAFIATVRPEAPPDALQAPAST